MPRKDNEPQELLTVKETAGLLRLSTFTVYRRIGRGDLTAYRMGGNGPLRIPRRAVDEYLQPVKGEAA